VFFRPAYQSRASKHRNLRGRTLKNFKNIKEKLELLNSFQKVIFNQQNAAPHKMPSGAHGPQDPPCYAPAESSYFDI